MRSNRKSSFVETNSFDNHLTDDLPIERRSRRSSLIVNPLMNKIKPFIYGPKSDDVPDCYNRVRYIRDACKVLSDLWRTDKDFLNKSLDGEISKSFKEFRSSEVARNYRSPYGTNGAPSILNRTIDDLVQIHDFIDSKRKESLEQFKRIIEQAKDKQSNIRQTINDVRDNYEKAQRKLETADTNLKKFQTRSDRLTLANFDERCRELEDIRSDCEQSRTLARDIYATEVYRFASEEHSITEDLFHQYLLENQHFYNEISNYLSTKMPEIDNRLENDDSIRVFGLDLQKHCSKRFDTHLAYPIEICICLLKAHLREEGLFRIACSQIKQKKFVAELDLQSIDKTANLNELGYDAHVPAATLKQYLRELPDCLLTSALLPQWNSIPSISSEQGRLQKISQLINQLPKVNYENLAYLVGFLNRVCEYSSENKMTAGNLGICIGCSLLYPKEQSNASVSNTIASASLILELMITHAKQLFNQQDLPTKPFKSQPDLIPTEFHSKSRSRSSSNENLLENASISTFPQPSPGARRKAKAPLPPPATPSSLPIQQSPSPNDQSIYENLSNVDDNSNEQQFTATSSSSFSSADKTHRRSPSGGNQLDRPGAPPPQPPPPSSSSSSNLVSSSNVQWRQHQSLPVTNHDEQTNLNSPVEEKLDSPSNVTTPTNENVNVGKLISELNNRMAAARGNNQIPPNNIRASSFRNSNLNSPGETTDF